MSAARGLAAVAAVIAAGAVLAGCTGGSDGGPVTVTASYASSPPTAGGTTALPSTPVPSTPATGSAGSSGPSSPAPTASIAQPPDPVVQPGNQGAWTLTRAAPGQPDAQQVASLQCSADGSVEADRLHLGVGGTDLTLVGDRPDLSVGVSGTSDADAAGGTFRGRNADTAVTFTWVC